MSDSLRRSDTFGDVATVLSMYAVAPDFLQYEDSMGCKLNKSRLLATKGMWRDLKRMAPTMCWSQRESEALMEDPMVHTTHSPKP